MDKHFRSWTESVDWSKEVLQRDLVVALLTWKLVRHDVEIFGGKQMLIEYTCRSCNSGWKYADVNDSLKCKECGSEDIHWITDEHNDNFEEGGDDDEI